jgi:hypothetical protein
MKPVRLIIAGSILLLLVIAGAGGWYAWSHSPKYSLKAVARAVEHHDRYEFEKHVDVDTAIQSMIADSTGGNALAASLGAGMAAQMKAQVFKAVEDGNLSSDSYLGKVVHTVVEGGNLAIDQQGRNAYFPIPITTKGGAPFSLKVHMTQVPDGYWKIDRIANMAELHAIEETEAKVAKVAAAKAIADKLAKVKVIAKLHTSVVDDGEKKNRFQIRFQNDTGQPLTAISGKLRVPKAQFDHGITATLNLAPAGAENAVWQFDVNQFIPDTVRLFALGETDEFEVHVDAATFGDGSKIERAAEDP